MDQSSAELVRRPTLEAERRLWQAAADLIAADLAATTSLRWDLYVEDVPLGYSDLRFNFGSGDTSLWGFDPASVSRHPPDGVTLAGGLGQHLADLLVGDVMIELARPWPECRVHRRPMDPTDSGPTGTWQCPKDPAHAAPIGGLAASGLSVWVQRE
jgi:hypothetical protein